MGGYSSKLRVKAPIHEERYSPAHFVPLGTIMFEKKQVLAVGEESYLVLIFRYKATRDEEGEREWANQCIPLEINLPQTNLGDPPCPPPVLCPTDTAVIQSVLRIISDRGIRSAVDVF